MANHAVHQTKAHGSELTNLRLPASQSETPQIAGEFSPVSDTEGRISKLFINLRETSTSIIHAEIEVARAIAKFTPGVELIFGVGDRHKDENQTHDETKIVRALLDRHKLSNAKIFVFNDRPWARDIGMWADNGKTFVVPATPHKSDLLTAEQCEHTKADLEALKIGLGVERIVESATSFVGGDFIPAASALYFGFCSFGGDQKRIAQAEQEMGKEIRILGNAKYRSPILHLDSGVIFTSNTHALMNDAQSMFDIVSNLNDKEFDDWKLNISNWYFHNGSDRPSIGMRSESEVSDGIFQDIRNIGRPGKFGYDLFRRAIKRDLEMYNLLAEQLDAFGVKVTKIPGIDIGFTLSSLNSLPDTFEGKRRLFQFPLGCPAIDNEVSKRITASGEIDTLINLGFGWPLAISRGGVRCVGNTLRMIE